jgi:phenylalanyl-tRNA synthetase beta chain
MAFTLMPGQVPLPRQKSLARPALDAPEFQAVERDFAFVLDERAEVGSVLKAAMQCGDPLVVSALVFDVFEGAKAHAQLGPGKMSVAVSVRLQPRDGTLTDAAIEAAGRSVVSAVNKATGAVLRT